MSFQDKLKPTGTFAKKLKPVQTQGDFRFDVPERAEDRAGRTQRYAQEAAQSAEEAKNANSFGSLFKNTVKGAGEILANSQVGLGRSIAKIIGASDTTLQDAQRRAVDTQVNLLKTIRDKESRGEDATRLKQEYNRFMSDPSNKEVKDLLGEQYNLPSTLQVVGQIGGTALDILTAGTYGTLAKGMQTGKLAVQGPVSKMVASKIPSTFVQGAGSQVGKNLATGVGLPELGSIATQKASGILTKRGLANIGTGLGVGYASDVTQGLQGARGEDRTGAKAFIPGMGTALGGALPTISEGTQSIRNTFTQEGRDMVATQKRATAIKDLEKKYVRVGKAFDMARKKGVDIDDILSNTNLLNGAVDEDGLVDAGRALANFDEMVAPYEGKVREAIQREGTKVQLNSIAQRMDDFLKKTDLQGGAQTQLESQLLSDLRGLQSRYGNNIPVEALHDIKIFRGQASNWADTGANAVNKEATRLFKEMVEENVRSLDVKAYNGKLSEFYSVRDALEALNKTRVKGARLGKYFASAIGTGIGASSGNPLLAVLGAEIGARTQGNLLGRTLGGNVSKSLDVSSGLTDILNTKVPQKEVIPPVVIPKSKGLGSLDLRAQSSNKAGSRNTSQATTNAIPIKAIPETVLPKAKKAMPKQGKEMFAGGVAGFERDEEGNLQFSPEKALVGMVGVAGLTRSQAVKKLSTNLDDTMRKVMTDFIDVVRGKQVVTKGGQLTFKSKDAEKAFDEGMKFAAGAVNDMDWRGIANDSPAKIANLFDEIVSAAKDKGIGKLLGKTVKASDDITTQAAKMKAEGKYKNTLNLQDKNDLEELGRIFSRDAIEDMKSGKMVNWRGTPYEEMSVAEKLNGKIKETKLPTNTFYHGTSADSARSIMQSGFKTGASLPEDAFRGGGYGRMQNSISLAETPKEASIFSQLSRNGEIVEVKLKDNAKVVSIDGVEDAIDLEDFIPYLKKQKVDAVYIGGGEKELVVLNPKLLTPTRTQLQEIWEKANKFDEIVSTAGKSKKPLGSVTPTRGLADDIAKAKAAGKTFDEWVRTQEQLPSDNMIKMAKSAKYRFGDFENDMSGNRFFHGTADDFKKFDINKIGKTHESDFAS